MKILFYEKPNCTGNARQKAILMNAGYEIVSVNLLEYPFTKNELYSYFKLLPINLWFNPSSPRIVSGEIDINNIGKEIALSLLISDRILIRRPLIEYNNKRLSGFDLDALESIGIQCKESKRFNLVKGQNLENCPGHELGIKCDKPRILPNM